MNDRHIMAHAERFTFWDSIIISLAIGSLVLLFIELGADLSPNAIELLRLVDLGIAFVFLGDFFYHFWVAGDRKHFFRTQWWQLPAALPVTALGTQALRGLMVLRLVRFARLSSIGVRFGLAFRSAKFFVEQTYLLAMCLSLIFFVILASMMMHWIEGPMNPMLTTFGDSVWWVISAVTTTGVDYSPVTTWGRVIGGVSMIFGFTLFGVFAGMLASYFSTRFGRKNGGEQGV